MNNKRDILFLLLLGLLSILYFHKQIFLGLVPFVDDLSAYSFSSKSFFASEVLSGRVPLWDPHLFGGTPYLANLNSAALYPFNWIFLALPYPSAVTAYQLIHLLLAGLFVYLWGKSVRLAPFAAFLSGGIYMLSGVFATENIHLGYYAAMVWTPAVFFAAEKWVSDRSFRSAASAGLALALILLSGSPQFLLITGICLAIYLPLRTADVRPAAGLSVPQAGQGPSLAQWTMLAAGLGLGLLAASAQLIPAMELIGLSGRSYPTGYAFSSAFSSSIQQFISQPFGRIGHGWVGVIPLLLSVWALVAVRKRVLWVFGLLTLFTTVMSWGDQGILFRFAYHLIPGFSLFRAWYRFILYTVLFFSLLAGFGVDSLLKGDSRKLWSAAVVCFLVVFLCIGLFACFRLGGHIDLMAGRAFLLLAASGLAFLFLNGKVRAVVFQCGLAGLLLLDVSQGGALLGGAHPLTVASFYEFPRDKEWIRFLSDNAGDYRVSLTELLKVPARNYPVPGGAYFPISPNLGQRFGFDNMEGYDQLNLRRYLRFMSEVPPDLQFILLNVRYIVTTQSLDDIPGVSLAFRDGSIRIYKLANAVPRYTVFSKARFFKDGGELLAAMRAPGFIPYEQALLEGDGVSVAGRAGRPDCRFDVVPVRRSPGETVLSAISDGPGYLVCNEAYAPGWKATVDGKRVTIWPAYHLFRAVPVPSGRHEVRFYYDPFSFRAGIALSFAAVLLIALIAAARRKYPSPPDGGPA